MQIKRHKCVRHIAFGIKTRGTWSSPQIASEQLVMSLNEGSRHVCEDLLQDRQLCTSSFKKIPVIKEYEKGCGDESSKKTNVVDNGNTSP
ncbi:hypothetical protein CDAR_426881 [Caerostris darwini]|uniref:Uncharacterized protein n=1 Tax=Caerostris darwini TaxID=1538125 RepID=A0AAV4R7U5_9ARAC|nr:hypothetical protein CDAR_426881 [Caerostris darwini]